MKRYISLLLVGVLLIPISVSAQNKKSKRNNKKPTVETVQEDPRIAQMLAATQKIMFIDSLVVNLDDFMRLFLSPKIVAHLYKTTISDNSPTS